MKPLTVVQVLPALESGGVERGTLEVGKYLADMGHRSIVISAGGCLVAQLVANGSEHIQWNLGSKSLWSLRFIPRLRHFLRENRVDILHVRSRMPAWICYLAWRGLPAQRRPRLISTVHGMYSISAYSAVMTYCEAVIAVSHTIETYIYKNYHNIDQDQVTVIPRGVDRSVYSYGFRPTTSWVTDWYREFPEVQGKKILLLPGRITRLKGHDDFLYLLASLRNRGLHVHGVVVGGVERSKQSYWKEIQQLSKKLGIEDMITFTGQRKDLREIMSISSIVLSLSKQPESFGRTVLEALSLGIPVLGYDHGGVGEQLLSLLPDGRVPLGNTTLLEEKVICWLKNAPVLAEEHQFTLNKMLAATIDLYSRLAPPQ